MFLVWQKISTVSFVLFLLLSRPLQFDFQLYLRKSDETQVPFVHSQFTVFSSVLFLVREHIYTFLLLRFWLFQFSGISFLSCQPEAMGRLRTVERIGPKNNTTTTVPLLLASAPRHTDRGNW